MQVQTNPCDARQNTAALAAVDPQIRPICRGDLVPTVYLYNRSKIHGSGREERRLSVAFSSALQTSFQRPMDQRSCCQQGAARCNH